MDGAGSSGVRPLAVLVLGVHRSGTSALAGTLHRLGIEAPEGRHPADAANPRGYYESSRAIAFHDALLGALGSASDDPAPLAPGWEASPPAREALPRLEALIAADFAGRPVCLFKDPRLCKLAPLWLEAFGRGGQEAVAVLPIRRPAEAAASLAAKGGLETAHGLMLWLSDSLAAEAASRGRRRALATYDELLSDWRGLAARLSERLGVAWPKPSETAAAEVEAFLAPALRHHGADAVLPGDALGALCDAAWAAFMRLRDDPQAPEALAALDSIRERIASAADLIRPLSKDWRGRLGRLSAALAAGEGRGLRRIVFLSGEPDTPGAAYRVRRHAEAAAACGFAAIVVPAEAARARLDDIRQASLLVIWRAAWSDSVAAAVSAARAAGAPVLFDIDDLLTEPELATPEIIDGMRTQNYDSAGVGAHFARMRRTLAAANAASCSTEALAPWLARVAPVVFVLPNGFDEAALARSRIAALRRRHAPSDGLVRLGYAAGSRTHQRDFLAAADAVADCLRRRPETRLVLFRNADGPVLDLAEFPAFAGLEAQVEWREVVPLDQLPDELARFDVNLAPLECGNPYVEAKSELKVFEAGLVDVPTVASPAGAYPAAVRDGENGVLAADGPAWTEALDRLAGDAALRRRMGRAAQISAVAAYGPERRRRRFAAVLGRLIGAGQEAADGFAFEAARPFSAPAPDIPEHETLFEAGRLGVAAVTVVVPLHDYAGLVAEALDSVVAQTLEPVDLIVAEDVSTDASLDTALAWMRANHARFNRTVLIRNKRNSGLARTRNAAFAEADTPYVLPLDPDNRLRPGCLRALLAATRAGPAAFAYPTLSLFGDREGEIGLAYSADRLRSGPYIDAMALVSRAAWAEVGGYVHTPLGWEDYDLWCRFAERGLSGVHVPAAVADYRVHAASMLRTLTDRPQNKAALIRLMQTRFPWLRLGAVAALNDAIAEAWRRPA